MDAYGRLVALHALSSTRAMLIDACVRMDGFSCTRTILNAATVAGLLFRLTRHAALQASLCEVAW